MIELFPIFDPYYHGFYLRGLALRFGRRAFRPCWRSFPRFERDGLAFVLGHGGGARIYLDADDTETLDPVALDWCDVYAKVNVDPAASRASCNRRVLSIGPGFGTRERWLFPLAPVSVATAAVRSTGEKGARVLARRWEWMCRLRSPLSAYYPSSRVDSNYLYFAASVWAPQDDCNRLRGRFIDLAQTLPDVQFQGGFAPPFRADAPVRMAARMARRDPHRIYLERTSRSVLAFNTPAVLDCLGWKLGEYLALGKAILSSPLTRAMPAPLEHGVHVHFVGEDETSILDGIERVRRDETYRNALERAARRYYNDHLAPQRVMDRILDAAEVTRGGSGRSAR